MEVRCVARLGPPLLGGVLTLTQLAHVQHAVTSMAHVLEVALLLIVALGVLTGGTWFATRVTPAEATRIFAWMLLGVVALWVSLSWSLAPDAAAGTTAEGLPWIIGSQATLGAAIGLVIGRYDLHVRRRSDTISEARRHLDDERDRFEALFHSLPNPAVYYKLDDESPIVRDVNPAFEQVFGVAVDEAVGQPIDDLIVPPEFESEGAAINRRAASGQVVTETVRRKTAFGTRDFLLTIVPLDTIGEGDSGFSISVDITEQKRREQRVEVLNRILRHDLRNGMNVVIGYLDTVESAEPAEAVLRARARAATLLSLSEKATVAESTFGIEGRDRGPIDLTGLVEERVESMREHAPEMTIETSFPSERAVALGCHPLGAAIDEVLLNAAVHGATSVDVVVELGSDVVEVVVRDDGPGIPPTELEVLEHERETALEHASGVGLWLVDWILSSVGGSVQYDAGENGSTVTLRLQRTAADAEQVAEPSDLGGEVDFVWPTRESVESDTHGR